MLIAPLVADLRFALRALRKHPAFAALAVVTIALAIGASTAIFSVVDGILLEPLPFPNADRLVRIYEQNRPTNRFGLSVADYQGLVRDQRTFEQVAALRQASVTLTGRGEPEALRAGFVSANWFATWGVAPERGRDFREGEDIPGVERVAMVSHAFAARRWADADPVGRSMALDGNTYTVVGVLPHAAAAFGRWSADVWPILHLETPPRRGPFFLRVVGRLAPDATLETAALDLGRVSDALFDEWSGTFSDRDAKLTPYSMKEDVIGDVDTPLFLLLGAVGFVLLIAIANVANLMLARASARGGEMAIRASLGASRAALVRQLLIESTVLAVIGGALGVWLSYAALEALVALGPDLPRLGEVRLNGVVLLFATGITLASGLLFGLAPMIHAFREQPAAALRAAGRAGSAGRAANRLRGALVSLEFALAVPLLAGAALLFTSLGRLQRVDAGIDPDNLLVADVTLPQATYGDRDAVTGFWDETLRRIEAIPGVAGASITSDLPPDEPRITNNFDLVDKPVPEGSAEPVAPWLAVRPEFFETVGIRLLRGRLIERTDTENSPPVVVVTRSWANMYYPGEDPIGKQLYEGGDRSSPSTVIGVVSDVKYTGLAADADAVYMPHQVFTVSSVSLVVRTAGSGVTMADVGRAVHAVDPDIPLANAGTMREKLAGAVTRPRYWSTLVTVFAVLGIILAAVGVYGVLSYFVSSQSREIGIRMALGANASSVRALVLRRGMVQAGIGLVIGLGAASIVTRGLESLLYQVSATDPGTFVLVAVALVGVALAACYLPARRATKVDPVEVLAEQ